MCRGLTVLLPRLSFGFAGTSSTNKHSLPKPKEKHRNNGRETPFHHSIPSFGPLRGSGAFHATWESIFVWTVVVAGHLSKLRSSQPRNRTLHYSVSWFYPRPLEFGRLPYFSSSTHDPSADEAEFCTWVCNKEWSSCCPFRQGKGHPQEATHIATQPSMVNFLPNMVWLGTQESFQEARLPKSIVPLAIFS